MADKISRFSVAMPSRLLKEFDKRLAETGKTGKGNRSDALRTLVRRYMAEESWNVGEGDIYGTVTIVYNHKSMDLSEKITDAQHKHNSVIICSQHVHLDADTCMECVIISGKVPEIREFLDTLDKMKGLKTLETVLIPAI